MPQIIMGVLAFALGLIMEPQADVLPSTAASAVRLFLRDSTVRCKVTGPFDDIPTAIEGRHYRVHVEGATTGTFSVSAKSGRVLFMSLDYMPELGPIRLSLAEAKRIGETFIRSRWSGFGNRRWSFTSAFSQRQGSGWYDLIWTEVLNNYGTLGPWHLVISVDASDGRVSAYGGLPDRPIVAPTVPRIPVSKAKNIASNSARFPTDSAPFNDATLAVTEDRFGVQWLVWRLTQYGPKGSAHIVVLDAVTGGSLGAIVPLGTKSTVAFHKNASRSKLPVLLAIDPANGTPRLISSVVGPQMSDGRAWIRVEMLRGLGVAVDVEESEVMLSASGRALSGTELKAEKRDYGWWIPIAHVARVFGWRVSWNPEQRAVLIDLRTPTAAMNP